MEKGFNLGENLACVLIAYPNTKSQSSFATVIRLFSSIFLFCTLSKFSSALCSWTWIKFSSILCSWNWMRNSLLFSMTLHLYVLGYLWPCIPCTWLSKLYSPYLFQSCIWLAVSKSIGSLRYYDKLISSLCFLGIPLIHLLKNIHFLSYQAYLAITTK